MTFYSSFRVSDILFFMVQQFTRSLISAKALVAYTISYLSLKESHLTNQMSFTLVIYPPRPHPASHESISGKEPAKAAEGAAPNYLCRVFTLQLSCISTLGLQIIHTFNSSLIPVKLNVFYLLPAFFNCSM